MHWEIWMCRQMNFSCRRHEPVYRFCFCRASKWRKQWVVKRKAQCNKWFEISTQLKFHKMNFTQNTSEFNAIQKILLFTWCVQLQFAIDAANITLFRLSCQNACFSRKYVKFVVSADQTEKPLNALHKSQKKKMISITHFYWVPIVSCTVIPIFHFIFRSMMWETTTYIDLYSQKKKLFRYISKTLADDSKRRAEPDLIK